METSELLARLADLLHEFGPDSTEVRVMLDEHWANEEFQQLAAVAIRLDRALRRR